MSIKNLIFLNLDFSKLSAIFIKNKKRVTGMKTQLDPKRLSKEDIELINNYYLAETAEVPTDLGFILGVNSPNIQKPLCDKAAQLQLSGYFNKLIVSGAPLAGLTSHSEAEEMADFLRKRKVENNAIILENGATNTQENVELARDLVGKGVAGKAVTSVHCFGNVYGGRRILMTMKRRWPEVTPALTLIGPRPDFKATWQDYDFDRKRLCLEYNKLARYTDMDFLREVDINQLNDSLQRRALMIKTLQSGFPKPK
jgi:uncharacterized SAM-binding protein YcdF (DUF218 family)